VAVCGDACFVESRVERAGGDAVAARRRRTTGRRRAGARQHAGGNLLIVGSIANIIVVDQARTQGVTIDWRMHAKSGVP
jgi:hypothetical protein